MKTIITIQHTQSVHHTNGMVGSWTDWELSELGVEQANRIGKRLKAELSEKKFVMYSSDLLRAKQTAEIVGQYLGLIPILRTELRERNLGKCCGKSVQWLRENLEMQEKTIDDRLFSDAESRRDEWNRLQPFFLGFIRECEDEDFKIENEPTSKVYKRYQEYCLANSLQAMSNIEFSKQINRTLNFKVVDKFMNKKKYRIFVPAD